MNHEEMRAKMGDFLLSGPDDLKPNNVADAIKELLAEYESLSEQNQKTEKKVRVLKNRAMELEAHLEEGHVMEKYRLYSQLKLKEQLLSVAVSVEELKHNQDVLRVPSIIKSILECSPKWLPSNSKIYGLIVETVASKRADLLEDFHTKFEAQLVRSEEFQQESVSWGPFLQSARGWILAYTMVCILPSVLRDMDQIVEKYQSSLDSAFTPLWGRFHFHLTAARESDSAEQILWTFEYSKTFISLLTDLCAHITRGGAGGGAGERGVGDVFEMTCTEEFRMAGVRQIVEKATKFLRAHIAESMSTSSWCDSFAISLLECSLDLDSHMNSILSSHQLAAGGNVMHTGQCLVSLLGLTVSSVFCDREDTRQLWLEFDCNFFRHAAASACRPDDESTLGFTSSDASGDTTGMESAGIFGFYFNSLDPFPDDLGMHHTLRCFKCVYDCLHLFRLACQRYQFLPANVHDAFSCKVLEPVLMTSLLLLFYRCRTHPVLRDLRQGRLIGRSDVSEATEVLDCCYYVHQTLLHMDELFPNISISADALPARYERTWKHTMNWMQEVLKSHAVGGGRGIFCTLQPQEVIDKMHSIYDKAYENTKVASDRKVSKGSSFGLVCIKDISISLIGTLEAELRGDLIVLFDKSSKKK